MMNPLTMEEGGSVEANETQPVRPNIVLARRQLPPSLLTTSDQTGQRAVSHNLVTITLTASSLQWDPIEVLNAS
jgi:hypothetical protein